MTFSCLVMSGQKSIGKSIETPRTTWVHIDTENCFELVLGNSDSEKVEVYADMDGEYREDLLIESEEEGTTLLIRPDFRPEFKHPNDKLSAHKIISISLVVLVPRYTNVKVYGHHTHVEATGIFTAFEISLDDGQCAMNLEAETVRATTQTGDIYFRNKGAVVSAESRYGRVEGGPIPWGNGRVNLRSTSGNIYLKTGH